MRREPSFAYFLAGSLLLHLLFLFFLGFWQNSAKNPSNAPLEMIFVGEEGGLFEGNAPPKAPSLPKAAISLKKSPRLEPLKIPESSSFSPSLPEFMVSEVKLKKESPTIGRDFPSLPSLPPVEKKGVKSGSGASKKGGEDYFSLVRRLLEEAKTYPLKARLAGYEGKVMISFTILSDGRITETKILVPSPYEVLNRAALNTIQKISPLPPPPESLSPPLEIELTINYRLN